MIYNTKFAEFVGCYFIFFSIVIIPIIHTFLKPINGFLLVYIFIV